MNKIVIFFSLLLWVNNVYSQDTISPQRLMPHFIQGEKKDFTLVDIESVHSNGELLNENKQAKQFSVKMTEQTDSTFILALQQHKTNYKFEAFEDSAGIEALLFTMIEAVEESIIDVPFSFKIDTNFYLMSAIAPDTFINEMKSSVKAIFDYFEKELEAYFDDPEQLKEHLQDYFIKNLAERILTYKEWMENLLQPYQLTYFEDSVKTDTVVVSPAILDNNRLKIEAERTTQLEDREGDNFKLIASISYELEELLKKLKRTNAELFDWKPDDLLIIDRFIVTVSANTVKSASKEYIAIIPGAKIVRVSAVSWDD